MLNACWQTKRMTRTSFWRRASNRESTRSFRPSATVSRTENMIPTCTDKGTWWRMRSYGSSGGEGLPHAMRKTPHRFLRLCRFDAWPFGQVFHDDTI